MSRLASIPVSAIRDNKEMLRGVNKETDDYKGLVQSIRSFGVIDSISVRDIGEGQFAIVNGLQRLTACRDLGIAEIPANILDIEEGRVLEAQIVANAQTIETKAMEYTKALVQVLRMNPTMTMVQLAGRLGKSYSWLSERFHLLNLNANIQALVNEGTIGLANAYALAKVPAEHQEQFLVQAQSQPSQEFVPNVQAFVKNLKAKIREGRSQEPASYVHRAKLQKLPAVQSELDTPTIAQVLISNTGAKTAAEGFALALKWVTHSDPLSIDAAKAKWDKEQAEHEELLTKRKAERDKKKAEEAKAVVSNMPGA